MASSQPNFRPMGQGPTRPRDSNPGSTRSFLDELRQRQAHGASHQPVTSEVFLKAPIEMPDYCFLVMMANRAGVYGFITEVEMTLFPPSTMRNHDFQLAEKAFADQPWHVVYFPLHLREAVEAIAATWCCRLREHGAIPQEISFDKNRVMHRRTFPIASRENVFTIENTEDVSPLVERVGDAAITRMRTAWANSVPLRRIQMVTADDDIYRRGYPCNVCLEKLRPGDTVAIVGDSPSTGLGSYVHIEHIDKSRNIEPEGE
ncbi:MAG: hypothetical protein EON58_12045 [Alphaproteobacteria bacterium]|nr:MAG: hypothetical protein EON58_12045 [Alphaproteobacteria bacterium]